MVGNPPLVLAVNENVCEQLPAGPGHHEGEGPGPELYGLRLRGALAGPARHLIGSAAVRDSRPVPRFARKAPLVALPPLLPKVRQAR